MNTNFKLWRAVGLALALCLTNTQAKSNVELLGDIVQIALPSYALGRLIYEEDIPSQVEFMKSLGTTILTTQVLKRATHIQRPDGSDFRSFPSGHTSAAFAGATFLHKKYNNTYQNILAYCAASYVGYSRLYANKHHLGDVVVGAILAYSVNAYFVSSKYVTAQMHLDDKQQLVSVRFWR